ncbi:MAG TPA: hypothetical protein VKR56_13090, partial [Candidatus Cybelea sp.]|nr:hypothetical protein [Candidatus Cybelea sp.]
MIVLFGSAEWSRQLYVESDLPNEVTIFEPGVGDRGAVVTAPLLLVRLLQANQSISGTHDAGLQDVTVDSHPR